MIRDFDSNDMASIIDIYTRGNSPTTDEIENVRNSKKILVYDDNGIKAFVHLSFNEKVCDFEMGVTSDELINSVGIQLWAEVKKLLEENQVTLVRTCHIRNGIWDGFYNDLGFDYWFSYYKLRYTGGKFNEPQLNVRKYEDEDYIQEIGLESEAFSDLRKESDITPHNWYLSADEETLKAHRKNRLNRKENFYIFFEETEMAGAAEIVNGEVTLLFVAKKHQGKGYGRKILEFAVNRGLEQNADAVNIEVMANNDKALGLYTSTGFVKIQGYSNRRLKQKVVPAL